MPGMIQVSKAKTSLLRKGFRTPGGGAHESYYLWVEEKKMRFCKYFSRGAKEIGSPLLKQIKRQLGLDREQEARDLLICYMTKEAYLLCLRERGHLPYLGASSGPPRAGTASAPVLTSSEGPSEPREPG
jgi:hypothetical protein